MANEPLQPKLTYKAKRKLEPFFTGGSACITRDNKNIVCACGDEVKVVDLETGSVSRTFSGDSEPITSLAVSPDCKTLIAASRSLNCKVWNLATGDCARTWKPHRGPVADMAVDASGGYVATASADRSVKVWDLAGGYCTHNFVGHSGIVLKVLFHPKQLMLFSAGDDADVRVWDLVDKSCVAVLKGHFSAVTCLGLSPDGWLLLSGGRDKVVNVWDIRTNAKVATVPVFEALEGLTVLPLGSSFPGVNGTAYATLLKSSSRTVMFATGGESGLVKVWRSDTATCLYTKQQHQQLQNKQQVGKGLTSKGVSQDISATPGEEITDLTLLPGGKSLMATTGDSRLLFFTPNVEATGQAGLTLTRQLIGNHDEITDLRYVGPPDQPSHLAVSTNSNVVRLFDMDTLSCAVSCEGHRDIVMCLDAAHFPNEGRDVLVSGSKDTELRVWDAVTGTCLAVAAGHVGAVAAVALSRKAKSAFVASAGADKLLKVWNLGPVMTADWSNMTGVLQLSTTAAVAAHDKDINSVAVAPNDSMLATASQDRTVKVWRLPSLTLSVTLRGHKRGVWSVTFSPVDQVLLTSSGDKTIKMWSLGDGRCLKTFEGHTGGVLRCAFATAGTQVLSSGADGLLKLWRTRTAECVGTFDEHADRVWALDTGGGAESILATGGADSTVTIWQDTTAQDAAAAEEEEEQLIQKEQDLENAFMDEDYAAAARLAFELRHPGRLLAVLRQQGPAKAQSALVSLVRHLSPEDLKTALEYVREWNTNSKNCHLAGVMLRAILVTWRTQDILAVQGAHELLDGLLAYSERHFTRIDRLLRSTFLLDYTLAASRVLLPADVAAEEDVAAAGDSGAEDDLSDLDYLMEALPIRRQLQAAEDDLMLGTADEHDAADANGGDVGWVQGRGVDDVGGQLGNGELQGWGGNDDDDDLGWGKEEEEGVQEQQPAAADASQGDNDADVQNVNKPAGSKKKAAQQKDVSLLTPGRATQGTTKTQKSSKQLMKQRQAASHADDDGDVDDHVGQVNGAAGVASSSGRGKEQGVNLTADEQAYNKQHKQHNHKRQQSDVTNKRGVSVSQPLRSGQQEPVFETPEAHKTKHRKTQQDPHSQDRSSGKHQLTADSTPGKRGTNSKRSGQGNASAGKRRHSTA